MMKRLSLLIASILTLALLPCCQRDQRPVIESLNVTETAAPVLIGTEDLILFQCTFFTAPDNYELLKNTKANHVAGVFSPEDGDRLVEQLKREDTFELMSAPSITTRQGQRAKVEIVREFVYPTEFDPPIVGNTEAGSSFPVTPTTPAAFETRNVGITAEFDAHSDDKGGIAFEFNIEHVNFLGFVNYGSPIMAPGKDDLGDPVQIILTENRIETPVFGTKRLASSVAVPNGHYLAIGGMRSDNQESLDARTEPQQLSEANPGLDQDKNLFVLIKVTAVKP